MSLTIQDVRAWVESAKRDGWGSGTTYTSESIDWAVRLERDGFVIQALMRPAGTFPYPGAREPRKKDEAGLSLWGPDGMAILPPEVYDWQAIKDGMRRCNYCKKSDVETKRVSFAGRSCADCLPAKRKELEYEGWTN